MSKPLRIGTRDSELALWQAQTVMGLLKAEGVQAELSPVKSTGDLILDKPLYELGITGIFTKTLDVALLRGDIDLAVHSMKDVPTALPKGIVPVAVLKRANPKDILVHKGLDFLNEEGIIATGSLRRKAQWLRRYPLHEVVDLRGNVNTRLRKLDESEWNAAIFAAAGLERIGLLPEQHTVLDWMVPAPAQGAMLVVAREGDQEAAAQTAFLHHAQTDSCVRAERAFLRELEGGCTAPIGALARMEKGKMSFTGGLFALDGSQEIRVERTSDGKDPEGFGRNCAREVLERGGDALMQTIRKTLSR
ncbi:hydroxymethylbilane synthase [Robiginitalea sediminis]|uniref:hydroxymethylbilane synthase n=1 Tax=Robiginitalea sediminis TaxID=1982593 RepID=UPI000B4C0916|nr:hydroxymethylbilane synthase [Robiginitalea sediminis]